MNPLFGYFLLLLCSSHLVLGCTQLGKSNANCYGLYLQSVPQNLRESVEILNLAKNNIKKIHKYSFEKYTKLRVLKIYQNSIYYIAKGSFEILSDLQELDMSMNVMFTIPLEILNLPSLRFLSFDSNPLNKFIDDVKSLENPIEAPLEYLNIAECELEDIPNLGVLPKLKHLNASMNPLKQISFERFSSFCALESIDLTENQMPYCECQEIAEIVEVYYRKTVPDRLNFCDRISETCPEPTIEDIILGSPEYQKCTYAVSHPPLSKRTWIIIVIVIALILLIVIIVVRQIQRKRQKKKLKRKKVAKASDTFFNYNHKGSTPIQKDDSDLNELDPSPA